MPKLKEENYNPRSYFKYLEDYSTENLYFTHVDENGPSNTISYYFNGEPEFTQLFFIDIPKTFNGYVYADFLGCLEEFNDLFEDVLNKFEELRNSEMQK